MFARAEVGAVSRLSRLLLLLFWMFRYVLTFSAIVMRPLSMLFVLFAVREWRQGGRYGCLGNGQGCNVREAVMAINTLHRICATSLNAVEKGNTAI